MERFAAHAIFVYPDLLFGSGIVEIRQGRVAILPFTEEIPHTSWISGMVVLLPGPIGLDLLKQTFNCKDRVIVTEPYVPEIRLPIYPYQLFPVDMVTFTFPDSARLIPLF